jgi:hypothetical protein
MSQNEFEQLVAAVRTKHRLTAVMKRRNAATIPRGIIKALSGKSRAPDAAQFKEDR